MLRLLITLFICGMFNADLAFANEHESPASPVSAKVEPLESKAKQEPFRLDLNHLPTNLDAEFLKGDISAIAPKILQSLQESVKVWPEEKQEEAEETLKLIDYNLQQYIKLLQTPPSLSQYLSMQKNVFTVPEILEICHQKKQCNHSLSDIKENLDYKEKKLSNVELLLGKTRKEYFQADENSLQRAMLGLKIVSYWTYVIELNEEKQQLSQQLESQEKVASAMDDNLGYAFDRVVVQEEDISALNKQMQESEEKWQQAHRNLEYKQQYKLKRRGGTLEEKQHYAQELIQSEIEEVTARLQLISLEIQQEFTDLIQNTSQADLQKIKENISEWKQTISEFEDNVKKWTKSTLSQLQKAVEAFSLPADEIEEKQKQMMTRLASITQNNQVALIKLASEIDDSKFILTLFDRKVASLTGSIESVWYFFTDAFSWVVNKVTATLFIYNGVSVTLWDIMEFFLIILAALWLSRAILAGLTKIAQHRVGIRKSFIYRIHHLIHYAILTLGFFLGLSVIGFDLSNLFLIAGALGVGIGFGLQTIVNNFISGIIILFESKLRIGDYVELDSHERGEIQEINFRSTIIKTNDGTDIILPNSHLLSDKVVNWTLNDPFRRLHIPFSIAYGSDKDLVKKLVTDAAKAMPYTLKEPAKPDPSLILTKLGDNGIECELLVWVDARASIKSKHTLSDYLTTINTVLTDHKIENPSPLIDVRMKK